MNIFQKRTVGKKGIAAALLASQLLFTAGCGSGEQRETAGQLDTEQTMQQDGYIVVGYVQVGSESDWRTTNTQSFKDVFTQENGYYLIFEDGQQKQENQVKAIRNLILQEVDYIVLDPIVETGWESVLEEAKEAGIPVILSDRRAEMEDDSLYTCWVGSDFAEEGRNAGHWRTDGFAEVLQQNENWVMLERQSGDFTQAKGQEVMKEFLEKYEDIDVVISENDNMTFGAIEAIREAGRTIGSDGDIIILSFDAVRDALKAIQTGDIAADFECNPLTAPLVEETIRRLEAGESVETYFDCEMDLSELLESRPY